MPPEQDKGDRKALLAASLVFLFCCTIMIILTGAGPFPAVGSDEDGDGLSDIFQDIDEETELTPVGGGEWKEIRTGHSSEPDVPFLVFTGSLLLIAIPLSVYITIARSSYREKARKEREEAAVMHDLVRRMAAFLEINPSLPAAVKYCQRSLPENSRSILNELLWNSRGQGQPFYESYTKFTDEWKSREPMIGRALKGLRSAEMEATPEEVRASARRTMDILSQESRNELEVYTRSLSAPSTALFGIGVLLPVLLATMIPLAGLSTRTILLIGAGLWIVLPLSVLKIGSSLVRKRPMQSKRGYMGSISPKGLTIHNTTGLLLGLALSAFSIHTGINGGSNALLDHIGLESSEGALLTGILGCSLLIAGILDLLFGGHLTRDRKEDRIRTRTSRLLQNVGSGIMEGLSYELSVARAVKDDDVVKKSGDLVMIPGLGTESVYEDGPISHSLKGAKEFSRAGALAGGRAIRALAIHLRSLRAMEEDMESRIKSSVGQMEITAAVFAPVMMGASLGIFRMMDSSGSGIPDDIMISGGSANALSPAGFILLSGVYLLGLAAVVTVTIFRLEKGSEVGGWHRVPRNIAMSGLSFTFGVVSSSLMFT